MRRAGKTLTRRRVNALPTADGSTRNGTKTATASNGNAHPPRYAIPYAANIGIAINATIQLEASTVSSNFARYTRSQSTGADTNRSRSFARKKLDSAVITFESSRIEKKVTSMRPSNLPASSGPISCTLLKYASNRYSTAKTTLQNRRPTTPNSATRVPRPSAVDTVRALAVSHFGVRTCSSGASGNAPVSTPIGTPSCAAACAAACGRFAGAVTRPARPRDSAPPAGR